MRNEKREPKADAAPRVLPPRSYGRSQCAGFLLLLLIFALLYTLTLDNGLRPGELLGGDLITHQYAQAEGRFSNAPGYPLYTLGGWLWFHLGRRLFGPDANPIPILSSYSTAWALLSLGLLYALILEVTRLSVNLRAAIPPAHGATAPAGEKAAHLLWPVSDRATADTIGDRPQLERAIYGTGIWPIAFLVTAFYGATYFFWYYAVTTEQYTSSVAWTLGVVWLAFRWERTRQDHDLLAIAFLGGVALAHQLTLPIILLPLLWFVLGAAPQLLRRPRLIAAAAGLAVLPLFSYAFVYVAGARHPEWRGVGQWASAWEWFWSFISTSQGRAELTWSWTPFLTPEFPALIWRELTVPGLISGLLGWATLGRRRARVLYATFALYLVLCWIDRLGNWYQVIMPIYALLALGIAAAAGWLWRWLGRAQPARVQISRQRSSIVLALAVLLVYRGLASYPAADARNRPDDTGLAPGWAILADAPPPGTAVLGTLPETAALNYLTRIWGQRPDLRGVTSEQARELLAQAAPLAVTRAALPLIPQEVAPDAHYSALGRTLSALYPAPNQARPADLQPWTHDFSPALRLAGGKIERNTATGETVVFLLWEARQKSAQTWAVSVRLTQGGQAVAQVDSEHPVFGAYPTDRWTPGEVIGDAYPFNLPTSIQPDGVTVILYRQTSEGGFVNLDVARFLIQEPVSSKYPAIP